MMCYRDKTFCTFGLLCKSSPECDRILTSEVRKGAEEWWGGPDAHICVYGDFPDCFVRFFEME